MSRKSEELANPNSCLNRAADDEPVFVLRANDPVAAKIVRAWADEYVTEKTLASTDGVLTHAQLSKAQEARGLANEMDAWRFLKRHDAHVIEPPQIARIDPMRSWRHRDDCVDAACAGCRDVL